MTLREYQDLFVNEFALFEEWADKFTLLIEYSSNQPKSLPPTLIGFRIDGCQSRTYFKASIIDGFIHADGWSNSSIMAGIIVCMKRMFHGIAVHELAKTEIDFHKRSGLIDNLTSMRKAALLEMVARIDVLSKKRG